MSPGRAGLAPADDLLDLLPRRLLVDPEQLQRLGCHPAVLTDEAEQDVLGADVFAVKHPGLFLGQHYDASRPVGEPLEHFSARLPLGWFLCSGRHKHDTSCLGGSARLYPSPTRLPPAPPSSPRKGARLSYSVRPSGAQAATSR